MNFVTVDLILFPIKNEDILPTGEISILSRKCTLKNIIDYDTIILRLKSLIKQV